MYYSSKNLMIVTVLILLILSIIIIVGCGGGGGGSVTTDPIINTATPLTTETEVIQSAPTSNDISGYVYSVSDGKANKLCIFQTQQSGYSPVAGAMVKVNGVSNTTTGTDGSFKCSGVSEGNYSVTVESSGNSVTETMICYGDETGTVIKINIYPSSMNYDLYYGVKKIQLYAEPLNDKNKPLRKSIKWKFKGNCGKLDNNAILTLDTVGSGTLTAEVDGVTTSTNINVTDSNQSTGNGNYILRCYYMHGTTHISGITFEIMGVGSGITSDENPEVKFNLKYDISYTIKATYKGVLVAEEEIKHIVAPGQLDEFSYLPHISQSLIHDTTPTIPPIILNTNTPTPFPTHHTNIIEQPTETNPPTPTFTTQAIALMTYYAETGQPTPLPPMPTNTPFK